MHVINLICILLDALHGNGWRAELVKVCILQLFLQPHLTSIVSTAIISSNVTPNIAVRITILSIGGMAVPYLLLTGLGSLPPVDG